MSKNMLDGGQVIVDYLVREKVPYVFGLCGHGWEMAERSGVRFSFVAEQLPLYKGALEAAQAGTRTGGDRRNRIGAGASLGPPGRPSLRF